MIKWKLVWQFVATLTIPLLYLLNINITFNNPQTYKSPFVMVLLGIIIAVLGVFLWITSIVNLGKSFGVLPKKQKRVRTGLYKHFNHPMYVGIWATFLGLSLANQSWQGLAFLNIVILPLLFIRAVFEEKKLTD